MLAAVGLSGALAGCSGVFGDGPPDDSGEATPTPGEKATSTPTTEATATPSPEHEAAVEITDVSLEEAITVGDPVEVGVSVGNTGGADGALDVSLGVDGEEVLTERIEVPAGDDVRRVLSGPEISRTGTVTVTLDGETVGDVAVEAPDVLHVALDGSIDAPGTEDAPLDSIADAVDRAGPDDTVRFIPGSTSSTWSLKRVTRRSRSRGHPRPC